MITGPLLFDLWFPGKPRGKGRANFAVRPRVKCTMNVGGQAYYTLSQVYPKAYGESTDKLEADMTVLCIQQMRKQGHFKAVQGPIQCNWVAMYSTLASDTQAVAFKKVRGIVPKMSTPDKDNIEKLIMDAGNTYLFNDDAQVIFGTSAKVYGPREGIRARFYQSDPELVAAWVKEEFPWPEEKFELFGYEGKKPL